MNPQNPPLITITLALSFLAALTPLHAAPPTDDKWRFIPSLSDEFNGFKLNTRKWHDHNPDWMGRQPALFRRENVAVADGKLQLTTRYENIAERPEGYHSFTVAAVKSKELIRYGYFEVRAKAAKTRTSSSFWMYHETPEAWTEIDAFEIGGAVPEFLETFHMDAHVFHTPTIKRSKNNRIVHSAEWKAPVRLADDYYVYGLEWNEKEIVWYFEGKPIRRLPNKHWYYPLKLVFDCETIINWFGTPKKENLPAVYNIDYLRVWKRESEFAAPYNNTNIPSTTPP